MTCPVCRGLGAVFYDDLWTDGGGLDWCWLCNGDGNADRREGSSSLGGCCRWSSTNHKLAIWQFHGA